MKQVKRVVMTEENIREIAKLFKDGSNIVQIADQVNLNVTQVANCVRKLRKLGVDLPSSRLNSSVYNKVAQDLKSGN